MAKKQRRETQEEKIDRKIEEFHLARERTTYAKKNFSVAFWALLISIHSLVIGVLTLLWVTGILRRWFSLNG